MGRRSGSSVSFQPRAAGWILGTHQAAVSTKHLQAYLAEYEFRFNRRRSSSRAKLCHDALVGGGRHEASVRL